MPSIGSLVLRHFGVFAVTLILAFFGLALAIGFLDVRPGGILPLLAILGLAQLAGSISAGKLIGRTTGVVPGEMFILRVAILTSAVTLIALLLFVIQMRASGWLGGPAQTDDPKLRDGLLLGGAIFFAAAAILARFGLIFGARVGQRQHRPDHRPIVVTDEPMEIYRSPHGYSHPQPSSYGGFSDPLPGPSVLAMIGRLFLLNILGGFLVLGAQYWIEKTHPEWLLASNAGSTIVLLITCYMTGSYYGRRSGRPMSPEFAWGVAGGYSLLSVLLMIALFGAIYLMIDMPMPQLPPQAATIATIALVAFLIALVVITFLMKAVLRLGSRGSAPAGTWR